jgi:hypothetical protein
MKFRSLAAGAATGSAVIVAFLLVARQMSNVIFPAGNTSRTTAMKPVRLTTENSLPPRRVAFDVPAAYLTVGRNRRGGNVRPSSWKPACLIWRLVRTT